MTASEPETTTSTGTSTSEGTTGVTSSTSEAGTSTGVLSSSGGKETTGGGIDHCGGCPEGMICVADYQGGDAVGNCEFECMPIPPACGQEPSCDDPACVAEICSPSGSCMTHFNPWANCTPQSPHDFACDNNKDDCSFVDLDCPYGEKCAPGEGWAWHSEAYGRCVPEHGDVQLGGKCMRFEDEGDDCAEGLFCLNERCVGACTGTPDNPDCSAYPGTTCVESFSDYFLCVELCDPLAADCPGGDACVPTTFSTDEEWFCVQDSGSVPVGMPCERNSECDDGLVCILKDNFPHPLCNVGPGCCTPLCDLNQGGGAQNPTCMALANDIPGLECLEYFSKPPPDKWNVGMCRLP